MTIDEEHEERFRRATPPERRVWRTPRVIEETAAETKLSDGGPFSDDPFSTPLS